VSGPHRNHVELRARKIAARQYVSETHDHKPDAPRKVATVHTAHNAAGEILDIIEITAPAPQYTPRLIKKRWKRSFGEGTRVSRHTVHEHQS
jgi:hypothetical protein